MAILGWSIPQLQVGVPTLQTDREKQTGRNVCCNEYHHGNYNCIELSSSLIQVLYLLVLCFEF